MSNSPAQVIQTLLTKPTDPQHVVVHYKVAVGSKKKGPEETHV
jgi:hypothetical protein